MFDYKNLKIKQMSDSKTRILFTIEDKEGIEACYSRIAQDVRHFGPSKTGLKIFINLPEEELEKYGDMAAEAYTK